MHFQFVLSLLLSSVFVYNSKGAIDAAAINGLHYATEIGFSFRFTILS
jgi:hypothetical protein